MKSWNQKNSKRSTTLDSNVLTVEILPLIKRNKKAKSEPGIPHHDLTEENDFVKIEVVTLKLIDTETREVSPDGKNSQINPGTESHYETVNEELFETPMVGSTRQSITTNTNNKSRSTKIPAPKVVTQQKRDSLAETTKRREGQFSNRNTASTSQNDTEQRYQVRSAWGITKPRKLKDKFVFKDNDSEEKFDNDAFF